MSVVGYYPIALDLRGRRALVVGGGGVAERKLDGLLAAGARVTLVAPRLTRRLATLARAGRVEHVARRYAAGDLDGHALVLVAVGDAAVSRTVAEEARARGVWVNVADAPDRCDFILPSVLRRGELVVAVSTGGASPALARAVRERLETVITAEYAALAALVAGVRRELRDGGLAPAADAWARALDDELRRLVAEGRVGEARGRLLERLGAA